MVEPCPFNKIDEDVLALTNHACSDVGKWTDAHAAWLRSGNNSVLVRQFMDEQIGIVIAAEAAKVEANRVQIMDSGYTGEWAK